MSDNLTDQYDYHPRTGDETLRIPLGLEFQPATTMADSKHQRRIAAMIALPVTAVVCFACLAWVPMAALIKVPLFLLVIPLAVLYACRFLLLDERTVRRAWKGMNERDLIMPEGKLWGIYRIDDDAPYICYFVGGQIGIYLLAHKGMTVGRTLSRDVNANWDGLADAYQEAGKRNITVRHIDFMGTLDDRPRFERMYTDLAQAPNEDFRNIGTAIIANLEEEQRGSRTPSDVFCLSLDASRASAEALIEGYRAFSSILISRGNWMSVQPLDRTLLGQLTETIYGIDNFSVADALNSSVSASYSGSIHPIYVETAGGQKRYISDETSRGKVTTK